MAPTLPAVISRYFEATNARDQDALLACFTDDAAVTDEDRTMHGRSEIRAWRDSVAAKFEYTIAVLDSTEVVGPSEGVSVQAVSTRLEGNFPGSPVELTFTFGL